jgi:exosome complex component RRP4
LHTRSLKYGKLRNGVFVAVSGTGGGGGVVRSRRQAFTLDISNTADGSGEKVDVILGVNGYIWISKHIEGEGAAAETSGPGITRIEENIGLNVYSSQNDSIPLDTMREIVRVRSVITALVENGLRVDEEMVTKGYQEAVEMARGEGDGDENLWLGGERGKRLADALVGR